MFLYHVLITVENFITDITLLQIQCEIRIQDMVAFQVGQEKGSDVNIIVYKLVHEVNVSVL